MLEEMRTVKAVAAEGEKLKGRNFEKRRWNAAWTARAKSERLNDSSLHIASNTAPRAR